MNIEPDSIVLPRLIPWIAESRLRLVTSEILLTITGSILIYIWLTRFFSLRFVVVSISAALLVIFVFLISLMAHPPRDEKLRD